MKKILLLITSLCFSYSQLMAQTGTTTLVSIGADGKLKYTPDAKGNIIPDFSGVGYKNSEEDIPTVAVVKTITAVAGDNTANIQNAINAVAAMPLDANGIRGALLLKAGTYNINTTLKINNSGIIIRGEGNSTILMATKTSQYDLFSISGSGGASAITSTSKKILGSYIPVGTKTFTLPAGHGFVAGDDVMLQRKPNQAWIHMLGMDVLSQIPCDDGGCNTDWTPGEYTINYLRKVVAVNGNVITLDAPNMDVIDAQYAEGFIMKYTWTGKIEKVGFEKLYFDSKYTNVNDEAHGWNAVSFSNTKNCWVNSIEVHHFGYSAVTVNESAAFTTIINCKNIDPISQTIGGRKYSFNINGQRNLVKNCSTNGGRHDYVTGAQTAGPNTFVNSTAVNQKADIGPHHRWATGILFDNIKGDFEQNAQNRLGYGTGHGWAGAEIMYWNCTSPTFRIQSPTNHINWAIGCKGNVTQVGNQYTGSPCTSQSTGNFIGAIPSLFERQLCERLGSPSCGGVTNISPTVTLTSPTAAATFTIPAIVNIAATAADADGTIAKVEFYQGTTLLNSDATAPYSYSWTGATAGTYSITAKAYDNKGAITTSSAVSITVAAPAVKEYTINKTLAPITVDGILDETGWVSAPFTDNLLNMNGTAATLSTKAKMLWSDTHLYFAFTIQDNSIWSTFTTRDAQLWTQDVLEVLIDKDGDGLNYSELGFAPNASLYDFLMNKPYSAGGTATTTWDITGLTAKTNATGTSNTATGGQQWVVEVALPFAGIPATPASFGKPNAGDVWRLNFARADHNYNDANSESLYTWSYTDGVSNHVPTRFGKVTFGNAPANVAPTVSLTAPNAVTTFTAPATITISANATDSDGSIAKVEFYQGTTLLNSDATAPYSYSWTNVAAGTYSITAKAYDNSTGTTTSAAVSITVNAPANVAPTVSLTAPTSGSTFTAPATVTISANASDADGSISKVEFYNGATLLNSDATAPYSYSWAGVAAGTYSITAKAYDNTTGTATSAAVSITVKEAGSNCSTINAWNSKSIYVNGDLVTRNNIKYQAKWWTQNQDPVSNSNTYDVWKKLESCIAGSTPNARMMSSTPANDTIVSDNAIVPLNLSIEGIAALQNVTYKVYQDTVLIASISKSGTDISASWPANQTGDFVLEIVATDAAGVNFYSEAINLKVSTTTSFEDIQQNNQVSVYPNPTTGILNIGTGASCVEVFDINGKLIDNKAFGNVDQINISELSNGVYILKISKSGQTYYNRVVKH